MLWELISRNSFDYLKEKSSSNLGDDLMLKERKIKKNLQDMLKMFSYIKDDGIKAKLMLAILEDDEDCLYHEDKNQTRYLELLPFFLSPSKDKLINFLASYPKIEHKTRIISVCVQALTNETKKIPLLIELMANPKTGFKYADAEIVQVFKQEGLVLVMNEIISLCQAVYPNDEGKQLALFKKYYAVPPVTEAVLQRTAEAFSQTLQDQKLRDDVLSFAHLENNAPVYKKAISASSGKIVVNYLHAPSAPIVSFKLAKPDSDNTRNDNFETTKNLEARARLDKFGI